MSAHDVTFSNADLFVDLTQKIWCQATLAGIPNGSKASIQPTPALRVAVLTDGGTNGASTSASTGRRSESRNITVEATANMGCISTETLL